MRTGQTIRPALSLNTGGGGLTPEQEAAIVANTAHISETLAAMRPNLGIMPLTKQLQMGYLFKAALLAMKTQGRVAVPSGLRGQGARYL